MAVTRGSTSPANPNVGTALTSPTISATVSRTSAGGVTTAGAPAPSGQLYVDEQGNYYTLQGTQPVNVGWDVVNALGGPNAATALPADKGATWRGLTGLGPQIAVAGADTSAKAQLKLLLDQWDLGSLADWAWGQLTAGASQEQILLSMKDQEAYKVRFGNTNAARQKAGLGTLSEAEILAYEKQAASMMRAAGLPPGFYDSPSDFADLMKNDVSVSELTQRVQWAKTLASNDPTVLPEDAQAFHDLYGVGKGDLAAYLLDPKRALPLISGQVEAAQTAARARDAGFGSLTAAQAERVAGLTGSVQQAAQGFTQLAHMRELMGALPGEINTPAISVDQQIAGTFAGDATAQDTLSRRQRARQAAFQTSAGDYSKGLGRSTTNAL